MTNHSHEHASSQHGASCQHASHASHDAHHHDVKHHDQHHHHDHDHHGHSHAHHHEANPTSALLWPLIITGGFALVEALGGWYTGSLALLGDAGHMVTDAAGLGLALLAAWIAKKPATQRHSYGLMRAEVIVALLNGATMLLVAISIVWEAIARLHTPHPVQGAEVMGIAFLGLLVNLIIAKQLHGHQHDLNHRAAFLHVLGDLLGSVAALGAGAVIYFTGWTPIDPILSVLISVLILISSGRLLNEALHVLMEGVPHHLNIQQIQQHMQSHQQVRAVHQVHVWALSSDKTALSAHVVVKDIQAWHEVLIHLRHQLHERFGITHITLQPEIDDPHQVAEPVCFLTAKH